MLDSLGQVAVPFNFGDLTILEGGRFLQEASDKSPKTYRLLNWQGKFIAEADIPIDLRVLDSGECFAALNFKTIGESQQARSLMFSADGRQIAEIPGRYMNDVALGSKKRFAKFWTVDKQVFWVDLETGKAFLEE